MRYIHCPVCGRALTHRVLGDEGPTPWCEACARPWFDAFSSCILALVHDGRGRILLLRENYISPTYLNLVSGYIQPGESAEQAALREIREETGLTVRGPRFLGTYWYPPKELLMIAFACRADHTDFALSAEVDEARWVPEGEALQYVHPKGPEDATYAVIERYLSESQ